ncbi:uncharacterized protein ColSpa_12417 [Colletotrichum spaethianum]|uniref:Uncharacterized protein n=1 Tax=Colletotrichum spaethianum TaxID=700344 RepID=A0AA37PH51_9PEZI|nr:uncharacterized protein ColSpa_12417 [Colletotrichum spaethianum]GKT52236.1 hypothetical protein ColSpa_12417 [Colletotrichum spaethianum]
MPSTTMKSVPSRFPFIEAFSQAVSSQERSGQRASTLIPAKVLVNLSGNVHRDLNYVSRLQEDVDETLKSCSQYHTTWIQEVRRDASQALLDFNSYLEHKMPASNNGGAPLKITKVIKNNKKMASLERELSAAHAGLVGIMGFLQMLGLKSGKLLLDPTQAL